MLEEIKYLLSHSRICRNIRVLGVADNITVSCYPSSRNSGGISRTEAFYTHLRESVLNMVLALPNLRIITLIG